LYNIRIGSITPELTGERKPITFEVKDDEMKPSIESG
jgi:hypothetical protein